MAISYIVGIPGSGKTYYAVYKIYKEFLQEEKRTLKDKIFKTPQVKKESRYNILYCNINQFKFEKHNKFTPFISNEFKMKLDFLYSVYLATDGKDDNVLIEKSKELNLYKALIVIDECHNFLDDKEDATLKWWLTYHRHLYQDIILITQDLSLVSTGYKSIAEYFYKAMPSAVRLFKNRFRYLQYTSSKLYAKDIVSKKGEHIPILKEIFELYHSGDKTSDKSVVRKFLYMSIMFFILAFFALQLYLKYLTGDSIQKQEQVKEINNNYVPKVEKQPFENKNLFIYKFFCVDGFCNLDGEKDFISQKIIKKIIDKNKILFYHSYMSFDNLQVFIYICENEIFEFLKGVSNEKNLNSNNIGSNFLPL